jgi:DNA repair protein RAD7
MSERPQRQTVKGPVSALSSFLREKGINVRNIARRNRVNENNTGTTNESLPPTELIDQEEEAGEQQLEMQEAEEQTETSIMNESEQVAEIQVVESSSATIKEKKDPDESYNPKKRRRPMEDEDFQKLTSLCANCNRRFISHNDSTNCHACVSIGASITKVKKQRKKRMNENIEVSLTFDPNLPCLRDLCVLTICNNINFYGELGFISVEAKTRLARILSKKRKITEEVLHLFLDPSETQLRLFDCTCSLILTKCWIPVPYV